MRKYSRCSLCTSSRSAARSWFVLSYRDFTPAQPSDTISSTSPVHRIARSQLYTVSSSSFLCCAAISRNCAFSTRRFSSRSTSSMRRFTSSKRSVPSFCSCRSRSWILFHASSCVSSFSLIARSLRSLFPAYRFVASASSRSAFWIASWMCFRSVSHRCFSRRFASFIWLVSWFACFCTS
ncbi:hypothetical protein NESM_000936800 [Novymonas esmeraldas]|uniref:Uncharacterized protein n=1 Tax=Novymonas esmeraldas TaxID=1808958 RepID=A0AAW0F091_9TRYP